MDDFVKLLLDSIKFLWPLAIIHQYERGIFLIFGRVWKVVQPGMYPKIPWFTDVHPISIAWEPVKSGRCDVTTKSDQTLVFNATAWLRVVDPVKAYTLVHDYEKGAISLLQTTLASKLADVDGDRLQPDKRGRLNTSLQSWVEKAAAEYGLEVKDVSFTSFIIAPRTYRVLTDSSHIQLDKEGAAE